MLGHEDFLDIMSRFDRRPVRTVAMILGIALIAILAAAEWLLTSDGARYVVRGGDSLSRPQRNLVMREWQPATIFRFGTPEICVEELRVERDGRVKGIEGRLPISLAAILDTQPRPRARRRMEFDTGAVVASGLLVISHGG